MFVNLEADVEQHCVLAPLPRFAQRVVAYARDDLSSQNLAHEPNELFSKKFVCLPSSRGAVSIHRAAEKAHSRKLGFRCGAFSETQSVPLLILRNPICRVILCAADRGYARMHEQISGVRDSRKLGFRYS